MTDCKAVNGATYGLLTALKVLSFQRPFTLFSSPDQKLGKNLVVSECFYIAENLMDQSQI